MRRTLFAVAVSIAAIGLASTAVACTAATGAAVASTTPTRWYGLPCVGVDLLAGGALLAGLQAEQPALLSLSLSAYLVGSPTIHLVHGQPRKAGASVAGRAVALLVGGAALLSQADYCTDNCG